MIETPRKSDFFQQKKSTKRPTESSDETLSTESPLIHPKIHYDEGMVEILRTNIFGLYIQFFLI